MNLYINYSLHKEEYLLSISNECFSSNLTAILNVSNCTERAEYSNSLAYKTAKLDTFLDVSSLETPSSYWYNEHCKNKRTILDHSHAFHK